MYSKKYYKKYEFGFTSDQRVDHQKIVSLISIKNPTVLDFGCGLGTLLGKINTPSKNKYGIETNSFAIKECRKKSLNVFKYTKTLKPLKTGFFDYIIMNESIEHLHDPFSLLVKLKKLLKRHGKIIITTPNRTIFVNKLDPSHYSEMSFAELEALVERVGFKIDLHQVSGFGPWDLLGRKIVFPIGRFMLKNKLANRSVSLIRNKVDNGQMSKFRSNYISLGAQQILMARL